MKLPPDYELKEKLDEDDVGELYLAYQRSMDRIVCVKLLDEDLSENPQKRQEFGRRCTALAQLSHPNLATVYDAGEYEGTCYVTMEARQGQLLSEIAPLSVEHSAEILIDVAKALHSASGKGIYHGRLEPTKVSTDKKVGVKVWEVGLGGLTRISSPFIPAGESPSIQADIYSIGALLHYLVTGVAPSAGVAIQPPARCRLFLEEVLSPDPSRRPQNYDDLIQQLERMKEPPRTIKRRARKKASPAVYFIPTIFVVLLLLVATLVIKSFRGPGRSPELEQLLQQYETVKGKGNLEETLEVLARIVDLGEEPYASKAREASRKVREKISARERARLQNASDLYDQISRRVAESSDIEEKLNLWQKFIDAYPDTPYAEQAWRQVQELKELRGSTKLALQSTLAEVKASLEGGNYREAVSLLEEFIERDPKTVWAEKARGELASVKTKQRTEFNRIIKSARKAFEDGDFKSAKAQLHQIEWNFSDEFSRKAKAELGELTRKFNEQLKKRIQASLERADEFMRKLEFDSARKELAIRTELASFDSIVRRERTRLEWEEEIFRRVCNTIEKKPITGSQIGLQVGTIKRVSSAGLQDSSGKVIPWTQVSGNCFFSLGELAIERTSAHDYIALSSLCLRLGYTDQALLAFNKAKKISSEAVRFYPWFRSLLLKAGEK